MSKIIVIGASGQLGNCLQWVAKEKNIKNIYFLSSGSANILDKTGLQNIFAEYGPQYCINCAAYTAVDKAEDEIDIARQVNRDGVANLSQVCANYNTTLIHISTDFVFSGQEFLPLTETNATAPVNVYGLTKLEGEQAIPTYLPNYFILRTSWLYSEFGNNFVKTMLRFGKERDELRVIWDQIGTPTYAIDLAACILHIIQSQNQEYGIYHYSNEGVASWYDFAQAIFDLSQIKVKVTPVRTAEYVTKATRPAYSVMDKAKIKHNMQVAIPYWRDSLQVCLRRL